MDKTVAVDRSSKRSSATNLLAVLSLGSIFVLYLISTGAGRSILASAKLQMFKTMLISIFLEALPFLLIGVFVSALLHVYISEQTMQRWVPRNPVLAILAASVLGFVFPICECGMVPVIRKLMKKGMPVYVAMVFVLAGPILNPIVFFSTFVAFRTRPEIAYTRMGLAFLLSLGIGLLLYRFVQKDQLRFSLHDASHEHHGHEHKIVDVMAHATSEFFEMGKYLLLGSLIAAGLQTFVSRESLAAIGQGEVGAHVVMMGLAYFLSLCSTSDAFVASSFSTTFSAGSLLAFLVFGPMMNLKGTLMLLAVFKTRFVLLLGVLVGVAVLSGSLLCSWLLL